MTSDDAPVRDPSGGAAGRRGGAVIVVAAVILAGGLLGGLWVLSQGVAARSGDGITVSGSAALPAVADTVEWTLSTSAQAATTGEAAAQVTANLAVLDGFLRDGGIPAAEISDSGLTTSPVYGSDGPTGRVEASASLRVRSSDVATIARLNAGIGDLLIRSGDLALSNGGPQYSVSTLGEIRPQVQRAAVEDARARAEIMVGAVGGRLGPPQAMSTGSVQVTARDSVEGEYGSYDLSTIEKSVRAVVSVTFAVE